MRTIVLCITTLSLAAVACSQEVTQSDSKSVADSTTSRNSDPDASPKSNDDNADNHHKQRLEVAQGNGPGFRGGRGSGGAGAGGFRSDMTTIHSMFADRSKIRRTLKMLPNGADALTESDDEKITALLQDHVPNMDSRVLMNQPLPPMTFHPVFVGLIKNADKYTLEYEETEKGVKASYRSDDPYVVMLVQEHAKLVSRFIKNGHSEIHAEYELPKLIEKKADTEEEQPH
ncbi:hypothetical protein AB1L42_23740 [Thalassoglobus sp. JC818]|uniref:hypothetical protein n=1 Tax=Thalassoglobus sp. JC818 TaxID=3232136 RepID=UPI0034575EA5